MWKGHLRASSAERPLDHREHSGENRLRWFRQFLHHVWVATGIRSRHLCSDDFMLDRSLPLTRITLLAYVACVSAVAFGLLHARKTMIATYGTAAAQANWQQWRDAAGVDVGPVDRDEPQSELPPALVLMKDHFRACLAFALLMTTVLFMTLVFMIRGAFFYEQPAAYQTDAEK